MNKSQLADISEQAEKLFELAPYVVSIETQKQYEAAIELADKVVEDYDNNVALFELLMSSIMRWEATAEEFMHYRKIDLEIELEGIKQKNIIQ